MMGNGIVHTSLDNLFSLSFLELADLFSSLHTFYFWYLNFQNSGQDLFGEYVEWILISALLIVIEKFAYLQHFTAHFLSGNLKFLSAHLI